MDPALTSDKDKHAPAWKQLLRLVTLITLFNLTCVCVFSTQLLGVPLYFYDKQWYYAYISRTKQSFGLICVFITQYFAPTKMVVTGDTDMAGQLRKTEDGRLSSVFPQRAVVIANHQIYSDWLYIWWLAYTSRLHGAIYIILKDSLKWIPIAGWAMQFYGFIFMSRKWSHDKPKMLHRLQKLKNPDDPMWLLIFPEGTNYSPNTTQKSAEFAEKTGQSDLKHLLLPRTTGLHFCLATLDPSIDYIYDLTIGYSGIQPSVNPFAGIEYTLKSVYGEGKAPKGVHIHVRRIKVKDVPLNDDPKFEVWLRRVWEEKDELLEYFYTNGHFPTENGEPKVETEVKLGSVLEMFNIFNVLLAAAAVAHTVIKGFRMK
ncbi:acyltransferase-domain-containing protein [Saitoella complicata NRRL Y-17804]|uniref:acyltransferase-domain-containing protein n=1 Tax=Saitoella complicata (strain BCRC 22490 / CBS 7301 / JCM 7358 / NBRC 10748 / NRRL Y-17804) TaxID=698492 RepID=UPI000867A665|nr:acyltransferase-domain-containing protein [Saitoella complicata NRRL Y-17804]ODQ54559.1 acyltransferase-domain-containing protein [Saitoella complicata NRRL Y-17804]